MGEHTFEGLVPSTGYAAEVRATNDAGVSPWGVAPFTTVAGDIPATELSRVELEHVMVRCLRVGTPVALAEAASVRAELAARTWQNVNPYE